MAATWGQVVCGVGRGLGLGSERQWQFWAFEWVNQGSLVRCLGIWL